MRLVYFAKIREKIGKNEEELQLDAQIETVAQLLDYLAQRSENYQHALQPREHVHVAIDKFHATHDDLIVEAREIALFPPMTGG